MFEGAPHGGDSQQWCAGEAINPQCALTPRVARGIVTREESLSLPSPAARRRWVLQVLQRPLGMGFDNMAANSVTDIWEPLSSFLTWGAIDYGIRGGNDAWPRQLIRRHDDRKTS